MAISYVSAGASTIFFGARSQLDETAAAAREAAAEAGKAAPKVVPVQLDVTDQVNVEAAAAKVEHEFGALDILIKNAGALRGRGVVAEADPTDWWQCMNVNVHGPYLLLRAFVPLLLKGSLKTAITVSSAGAHLISPALSSYQTSELAVLRLTEFVTAEYAKQDLITFAVHPGNILTDIVGKGEGMDEQLKAVFAETPQLCGDALVHLTKVRQSWLSGRYVNVTWDLPELLSDAKREEIVKEDKLKIRLVV